MQTPIRAQTLVVPRRARFRSWLLVRQGMVFQRGCAGETRYLGRCGGFHQRELPGARSGGISQQGAAARQRGLFSRVDEWDALPQIEGAERCEVIHNHAANCG